MFTDEVEAWRTSLSAKVGGTVGAAMAPLIVVKNCEAVVWSADEESSKLCVVEPGSPGKSRLKLQ